MRIFIVYYFISSNVRFKLLLENIKNIQKYTWYCSNNISLNH